MRMGNRWKSAAFAAGASLAAVLGGAQAETYSLSAVSFRDFTGTVDIKTTSGDEIDIAIRQGKVYSQVRLEEQDGVLVVAGEPWKEDDGYDCCNRRILRTVNPRQGREATTGEPVDEEFFADYPTVEILMPYKGDVEFVDARIKLAMERLAGALNLDACYVYGETSDVGEAVVGLVHGSRLVMGNIGGGLEIDLSGDADLRAGDASIVDVDIAGPGDAVLGDIGGMLDVSIAGSGLVRATRVDGPVTARIAGSGALAVKAGKADRLRAFIDGSGGVFFRGAAVEPDLTLYGSAEVHVDSADGRIVRRGGGSVYVGGVKLEDLDKRRP